MRISDWSSDVCSSDLAEALRLQITGRVEHFLHARPALGAFVADDDDVAGADLTPQYAHHGGVLALIDARRAGEGQNVFVDAGRLHDAALGREVAEEHRKASLAAEGMIDRKSTRLNYSH